MEVVVLIVLVLGLLIAIPSGGTSIVAAVAVAGLIAVIAIKSMVSSKV